MAQVEQVTAEQAVLRVPDLGTLGLAAVADVSALVMAFDERFGSNVAMKITDGGRHVWTGPGTVRSVELIRSEPRQAIIGVGFRRALREADLAEMARR